MGLGFPTCQEPEQVGEGNPHRQESYHRGAAGFHLDCPPSYLDKALFQMEMTLNIVRPFEYDPAVSAYEGLYESSFDFKRHPIAPVGTKVLTWDAPDHRGSWADHGVPAVYLGPAPDHFRAFEVWVPNTSAARITNTVWWFMHDVRPDTALLEADETHAYPPTKSRPDPQPNGADLIGRVFIEPEIGVCHITGLGPVTHHRMVSRAQAKRQRLDETCALPQGSHYTLTYVQQDSGEEHYSSLTEILDWIVSGPILQAPSTIAPTNATTAPITTPLNVPATIQYVPTATRTPPMPLRQVVSSLRDGGGSVLIGPGSNSDDNGKGVLIGHQAKKQRVHTISDLNESDHGERTLIGSEARKQRVSDHGDVANDSAAEKQRVSLRRSARNISAQPVRGGPRWSDRLRVLASAHLASSYNDVPSFTAPDVPLGFEFLTIDEDSERFRKLLEEIDRRQRAHLSCDRHEGENEHDEEPDPPSCLLARTEADTNKHMPNLALPSVFPSGPLNLNSDGTPINYKKSHSGPHAEYWERADAEEMERLFVTGAIKPELFQDIPRDRVITYVNPVCVEKTNDDGSLKFRTRLTIGGDRIEYPYDTAAVTAEMDAIKILLNCMIYENANWSTIDLTDFYLGTDLPHPEYIRIPRLLIPTSIIELYALEPFFSGNALYCSVHKTHYPRLVL
jgi:hypothetical protein